MRHLKISKKGRNILYKYHYNRVSIGGFFPDEIKPNKIAAIREKRYEWRYLRCLTLNKSGQAVAERKKKKKSPSLKADQKTRMCWAESLPHSPATRCGANDSWAGECSWIPPVSTWYPMTTAKPSVKMCESPRFWNPDLEGIKEFQIQFLKQFGADWERRSQFCRRGAWRCTKSCVCITLNIFQTAAPDNFFHTGINYVWEFRQSSVSNHLWCWVMMSQSLPEITANGAQ